MPRKPAQQVPRWKRGKKKPASPVVQLKGRHGRAFARELARANHQASGKAGQSVAVRSGAWRFRRHLPPFIWLAALILAGLILHRTRHPLLYGNIAGCVLPFLLWRSTRHLPDFDRHAADLAALVSTGWLPALAVFGWTAPVPAVLLVNWAIFAGLWVRHYCWRPEEHAEPAAPVSDVVTWERLAARRKWAGRLTSPEEIPGGRKWQVELDGIETHIGQVMSEPRAIAAAWGKAQTEAYAEPHPTGIESRGVLTLLKSGTLETIREWDGIGFDENGIGRVGRFADSQPARVRAWVPRDGTRHGLIAGCMGSGKTQLLDLLIWLALTSPVPVVPVILDPQNGQSLPQWRGKVLYAAGVESCARMVRGLHAGMMDRSRRLASMTWDDDGHKVRGMSFFDATLTGLPIVMPIIDESPVLLSGGGNAKLSAEMIRLEGESGKLGRKTGKSKWYVAQVPSLSELGDQALRSMLVGGNVICLRTGDRVSAGMIGLEADPSVLPKYFPNGEPTGGLGYAVGIDNRQAPMRGDLVPGRMRHETVTVPALDDGFLEAMDRAMGGISPTAAFPAPSPAPAPEQPPADDSPDGRRCIDAVWQVLSASNKDMDRGEIISWVNELATGAWERPKPFSIRAVGDALRDLVDGKSPGREVAKPRDGVYRAVAGDSPRNDTTQGAA